VGRKDAIDRCRRHPLARALRIDKLSLAALVETLRAYLDVCSAWHEIPILDMLQRPAAGRRRRARLLGRRIAAALGDQAAVSVVESAGEVGGGSLPGVRIPSFAVALRPPSAAALGASVPGRAVISPGDAAGAWAAALRQGTPPILGIVREGALLLDVLALMPRDDREIVAAVPAVVSLARP
jgi:L-seryl-tRNA(Ser) seleniumtransferase